MVQFTRFVETGRVCLVTYGDNYNKLCVITDIINDKRVVVEGPTTGVARQQIPLTWLTLTPFSFKMTPGSRSKVVKKFLEENDIVNKFAQSSWGKKIAKRASRAELTDMGRFKALIAGKRRSYLINKQVNKIKKTKKN